MENKLEIFESEEFGKIRIIDNGDGELWFIGKDIASILGYSDLNQAIKDNVDYEDRVFKSYSQLKSITVSQTLYSDNQQLKEFYRGVSLINESGLYSLILKSTKPNAHKFKRWVTSEVLPSIRKHGGYILGQEQMTPEEIMAKAVLFAHDKINSLEKRVKEKQEIITRQQPKVLAYDTIAQSPNTFSMRDTAKLVGKKDFGRNKLLEFLRAVGVMCKNNTPMQRYVNSGYFEVSMSVFKDPYGKSHPKAVTYTTYRGIAFIINAMFKKGLINYDEMNEKNEELNNLMKNK